MCKYIIGIDLGTTNVAVSYLDPTAEDLEPRIFNIIQVSQFGECEERETLPSFIYLPGSGEFTHGSLDLPWSSDRQFSVGTLARDNASAMPGRTVSSAKSWLCASNVDRLASILPWAAEESENKLSPLEASKLYLEHIKDAWNYTMASDDDDNRIEQQKIILTVPASFDAVARELTVQAAQSAGLSVTLIEEPQAAFYSWLQKNQENWRDSVVPGDRIVVCDIGGGTTDFSLIEVVDDGGNLGLTRIAVGSHILLGGDNLDLALAYSVANELERTKGLHLDNYQIAGLTHACRGAKEILFNTPQSSPQKITVLGRGSSVIGGTINTELTMEMVERTLMDGFFPACELGDKPSLETRTGLRVFGLNYESDPAVTKHLAAFLSSHCLPANADRPELPSGILFNGGVTKAKPLRTRITDALMDWKDGDGDINVLDVETPDLAVAAGACWYGYVSLGKAIRIKAGSPHSYYVGIESSMPAVPGFKPRMQALCVVPFGLEEGSEVNIPFSGLGLVVGERTEYRFFASNTRKTDQPGEMIDDIERADVRELPVLSAELPADDETPSGTVVPIHLNAFLSEIGTLQLSCAEHAGKRNWKLEYELRAADTAG